VVGMTKTIVMRGERGAGKNGLTVRQMELLIFIKACIRDEGFAPSIREMVAHLGVSGTNAITDHLGALVRKGYLYRAPGKARAMRVL